MSHQRVRYVYALLRSFAADTSSGGRDRTVILGSDGSEVSWDGDRIQVVEPAPPPERPDRIALYVAATMATAGLAGAVA